MADWDPESLKAPIEGASGALPPMTMRRLRVELKELLSAPLPGIFVVPDDVSVTRLHALITGPEGTPYANGFFVFLLAIPADYPSSPPKVKLMTTGGGKVRFGPNLYVGGKVCLSILGTSLLNAQPYRNEPGLEGETDVAKLEMYNTIIAHETLRVAVIDNVSCDKRMPDALRYASAYARFAVHDGSQYKDPFSDNAGTFAFNAMLTRIAALHEAQAALAADEPLQVESIAVADSLAE